MLAERFLRVVAAPCGIASAGGCAAMGMACQSDAETIASLRSTTQGLVNQHVKPSAIHQICPGMLMWYVEEKC